jgi:flagellar protein FlaF
MSYTAYAGVQKASETPRELEIRAVSFITRQLSEANRADADRMTRIRALNGNAKLWSMLIADLSNPDNALPDTLKASYISIGLFAKRASVAALFGNTDLSPLIQINTDLLEALNYQISARQAA